MEVVLNAFSDGFASALGVLVNSTGQADVVIGVYIAGQREKFLELRIGKNVQTMNNNNLWRLHAYWSLLKILFDLIEGIELNCIPLLQWWNVLNHLFPVVRFGFIFINICSFDEEGFLRDRCNGDFSGLEVLLDDGLDESFAWTVSSANTNHENFRFSDSLNLYVSFGVWRSLGESNLNRFLFTHINNIYLLLFSFTNNDI